MVTTGTAKYVYLDSTEVFNGEDTGKYTLTVAISDNEAKKLEDLGVKVRTIKADDGTSYRARKFSTKYPLSFEMIKTTEGEAIGHDFGPESEVQILWKAGNEHPTHGVATYLTAIKVSKRTEGYKSQNDEANEFFG
jgi:hypothetical protein